jgi:DNA repair protein RadC
MEDIKGLPPMERPREKLSHRGPQALSDAELLAILFGSGTRGVPVSEICDNLLRQVRWSAIAGIDADTLCKVKGIGEAKAMILLAVVELSRRLNKPAPVRLKDAAALYGVIWPLFEQAAELRYMLVLLTAERELLATADAGIVLPEITWVTSLALEAGAKKIVLGRNGWLTFSNAEGRYAGQLKAAAGALGLVFEGLMAVGPERFKMI